jgi:hypothetical protein
MDDKPVKLDHFRVATIRPLAKIRAPASVLIDALLRHKAEKHPNQVMP